MRYPASIVSVDSFRSLRSARPALWFAAVALLLRLTAPFLHAMEIGSACAEAPATASLLDECAADAGSSSPAPAHGTPHHDPDHCPICSVLIHAHAATAEAARVPAPSIGLPVVMAESRTATSSDVAVADARAPPSSSLVAIS